MTTPTLIVEVGFTAPLTGTVFHLDDSVRGKLDTNTLAAGDLFTDVTQFVTSVNTRRGATRADGPTLRYEAGTCTITFNNNDRRFDPTNLSGPYVAGGVTQVEPMRAVRIRATYNGQTWPLWRGFTDQWSVAYDGPNKSTASVTCFDAFGVFSAHDRIAVAPVGAGETTSARVGRILDSISWPTGDRMIGTGEETVQATTLADNVLSELQLTADTELGDFFMDADGRVRFRARSAGYTSFRSTYPIALFGDQVADGVNTTVNLVANPSVETNLTYWSTGGSVAPTIARSNTRAMFGSWSILATWGTAGTLPHVRYDFDQMTVGRTYTISVYLWVPSGSLPVTIVAQGTFGGTTSTFDAWERITWTGTAQATTLALGLWPVGTPAGGETFYIDGLQLEENTTATAYVDGDQTLCEWDGVAHASTSRRLPELPYSDAVLTYDALSITNSYQVTRTGGTQQTTSDSGSVSAFLTRSHQRTDLLMQTDAEALMWAEQLLARTALPELRFAALELKATRDPNRLWAQAFGREIGDRIRVIKRPPGGGAPIEREAWVRGIEHNLPVSGEWQTTLVLEQTQDVIRVVDTFTRTTSNGWGAADSGQTWSTSGGTAANYSVSGSVGQHSATAVNSSRWTFANVSVTNVDVTGSASSSALATGGSHYLALAGRSSSDGATCYLARLDFTTTAGVVLTLRKRVAGAETQLSTFTTGLTHAAGTRFSVRFQVVGTTLRARAWLTSSAEPSTWQLTATDSSITGAGLVGMRSILSSANTNTLPVVMDYDNYAATELHAWV